MMPPTEGDLKIVTGAEIGAEIAETTAALKAFLGRDPSGFKVEDLRRLALGGYTTLDMLTSARKASLEKLGLRPGPMDAIVTQNEAKACAAAATVAAAGVTGKTGAAGRIGAGVSSTVRAPPLPVELGRLVQEAIAKLPTSAEELNAFLLSGPAYLLPSTIAELSIQPDTLLVPAEGRLATIFSGFVLGDKILAGSSEADAGRARVGPYFYLLVHLERCMDISLRIGYQYRSNLAASTFSSSSADPVLASVRPDGQGYAGGLILLVGEEKVDSNLGMAAAWVDLKAKCHGLPRGAYGSAEFILLAASAGATVEFGLMTAAGEVQQCSTRYNLDDQEEAARAVGAIVQVYRIMRRVLDDAPPLNDRIKMYDQTRPHNTSIRFVAGNVWKTITDFHAFCKTFGNSLEAIQGAYAAGEGSLFVVQVQQPPTVQNKRDASGNAKSTYTVKLSTLGRPYSSNLDEQRLQRAAYAMLSCAALLHAKQLVHRDFRLANLLWQKIDGLGWCPFVVDMELADKVPSKPPPGATLTEWDDDTCTAGKYTCQDEVHQIGKALRCAPRVFALSKDARHAIERMLNRDGTAEQILEEVDWLKSTREEFAAAGWVE